MCTCLKGLINSTTMVSDMLFCWKHIIVEGVSVTFSHAAESFSGTPTTPESRSPELIDLKMETEARFL